MRTTLSRSFASFLLIFSIFTLSLPQIGYAQTTATAAATTDYLKQLQAIEDKTEARRKELGIPGMSLVIVKDDRVIYMKGLGYKDYENKVAVTPDTQFAIGSATKAFTALSVLMSMDEGKLSLEDSPKKVLPYFKMFDPDADKNILIRDLLSHSSGLNRTDLAMITGKLNRAELIQVAAQAKPTGKLREKFQYQNIMYAAAGEIVAQAQKTPWEKFVPERIFKPLGMTNSTMSMKQMQKVKDYSFGYDYNFDTKVTEKRPFREIDEVAPAGSINSSARDMAEWLRFVLNGGTVNGKRLVSERGFEEWLKPQMKVAGTTSYGFGWFLQDWNGLKVVQHGGNIDGFNSMVAMIPEKKIGFVMLTNVSGSSLGNELMQTVWSNLIDLPKSSEAVKLPVKTMQFMTGKYRLEAAKMDFEVKIVGENLVMVVPGQPEYTLERTGPRQFKMVGAPDGFAVKFSPEQGDATSLYLQQPQGNYTLPRINADGTLAKIEPQSQPAGTIATGNGPKELIGRYTPPGSTDAIIEVKETDGKVTFNVPGQQPYALIEKSKDAYSMSPLPDTYSLRAKRDDGGKVISVVVTQPEGEFEFKRSQSAAPAILLTVDELMQKAIDASGGEANWRKLSTRVSTFDTDLENQGVKAYGTAYAKAPDRTATETTLTALGKTIARGWDFFDGTRGEEAYTFAPVDKYTGKRLEDIKLGSQFYGTLDWKKLVKKAEILRMAKVGEEECFVVEFTPINGSNFTEYYSARSFLLRKREGVITSSTSAQKTPYTLTFDDYREIDGIKLPFKTVSYNVGNGNIVTMLKSVKHNVPIDDKLFAPRKLK
ncbi:MAG: serine hydrolase [Pyrinomonadaceae bacterium]|nr:serine hydrolase [Pyrinomonadaceae bacterium]MBP6212362.1 serine hydrolase [Pyrinomonadaceae bacterium]